MNGGGSVASLSLVLLPRDLERAEAVIRMRGSKSLLQIENILILPQLCSPLPENRMEIHTQGNGSGKEGLVGESREYGREREGRRLHHAQDFFYSEKETARIFLLKVWVDRQIAPPVHPAKFCHT